ncbi:MAG: HPP family protein [Saprospiraceae bacterium]
MLAFRPVSTIMTRDLITVSPSESLENIRNIFAEHKFHHIPVVVDREIVGIVSRSDVDFYVNGANLAGEERKLQYTQAKDIMTSGMAKLEPGDRINVALEVFMINRFHALPVVENGELVGIVTPYDIMRALLDEKPAEAHLAYDE